MAAGRNVMKDPITDLLDEIEQRCTADDQSDLLQRAMRVLCKRHETLAAKVEALEKRQSHPPGSGADLISKLPEITDPVIIAALEEIDQPWTPAPPEAPSVREYVRESMESARRKVS